MAYTHDFSELSAHCLGKNKNKIIGYNHKKGLDIIIVITDTGLLSACDLVVAAVASSSNDDDATIC